MQHPGRSMDPESPPRPSLRALAGYHWRQYVGVVALWVLVALTNRIPPHQRSIYSHDDSEYWIYSYPHLPETFPDVLLFALVVVLPLLLIAAACLLGLLGTLEGHHLALLLLACVASTGIVTTTIKTQVARPRPDFVARCWPSSPKPVFDSRSMPLCDADASRDAVVRGMRSFPSGHSSWSAASLGLLSLFLMGRLRVFRGALEPVQLAASLAPALGSVWIGISRIQTNKHHSEDVAVGWGIGLLLALLFYRQLYPSPLSPYNTGRLKAASAVPPPFERLWPSAAGEEEEEGEEGAAGAGYSPAPSHSLLLGRGGAVSQLPSRHAALPVSDRV